MRTRKSGVSVIELIVSVGLFSVILVSLAMILNAGYNNYWEASGSLEVQKAAMYGTRLLIEDLGLSNSSSVEIVNETLEFDQIVFASPRDLNGDRRYSERGQTIWQSYIAYYTQDFDGVRTLFRNAQLIPGPSVEVPLASDEVPGITPNSIAALGGAKLILRGVSQFKLEKPEGQELVKITLSGFFEQRGLFTITVRNQVLPRN